MIRGRNKTHRLSARGQQRRASAPVAPTVPGQRTRETRSELSMKAPAAEVSERFIEGMRSRMAMSYFKYGPVRDAYPHKVSALESLRHRLARYEQTGNTEWLIYVA